MHPEHFFTHSYSSTATLSGISSSNTDGDPYISATPLYKSGVAHIYVMCIYTGRAGAVNHFAGGFVSNEEDKS